MFIAAACLLLWGALAKTTRYATAGRGLLFTYARPVCTLSLQPFGALCARPKVRPLTLAPDFGALMKIEGDSLQDLLEQYKGITTATLDLSTVDITMPGLIRIVRASGLTGKEYLAVRLEELQEVSLDANNALERLSKRIYYCADR